MEEFFTVKKRAIVETNIERSRFITTVIPVKSEEEAKNSLDEVRKIYSDATHNCYAYVADKGAYSRYSDDGEPQGTAGPPIYDVIKNNSLVDTLIVVTRYFGGIKLGTGGLTRAYGGCAAAGVKEAEIVKMSKAVYCSVSLSYGDHGYFQKLTSDSVSVICVRYENEVVIDFCVKKSAYNAFKRDFCDLYSGRYRVKEIKEDFARF